MFNATEKLELIKGQRQKDAKELVNMKHLKERAVTEVNELRRQNKELQEKLAGMEDEMGRIRESVSLTNLKLGNSSHHDGGRVGRQPQSSNSHHLCTDLFSL